MMGCEFCCPLQGRLLRLPVFEKVVPLFLVTWVVKTNLPPVEEEGIPEKRDDAGFCSQRGKC